MPNIQLPIERKRQLDDNLQKYETLMSELGQIERETTEIIKETEKELYEGKSHFEYLLTVDEVIQVSDHITISIQYRSMTGTYRVNDNITIVVVGSSISGQSNFSSTITYKESGKVLQHVPAKYESEFKKLLDACLAHQLIRPTRFYIEKFQLGSLIG